MNNGIPFFYPINNYSIDNNIEIDKLLKKIEKMEKEIHNIEDKMNKIEQQNNSLENVNDMYII